MLRSLLMAVSICGLALVAEFPEAVAANRCLHIVRQGNIETLLNRCGQCQIATLMRMRPGGAKPVTRNFPVLARSTATLPFKGSGQSRIKSERICPRDRGKAEQAAKQPNTAKCVTLKQVTSGAVLINRCGECRAAAIQRSNDNQATGVRDYMTIATGQSVSVPSRGYTSVGLLADIPCP
jgi:hypothetical protein